MNHIYRSIRNEITGAVVTVSEHAKRHGKQTSGKTSATHIAAIAVALLSAATSQAAPTDGTVVAGNASISNLGGSTTINQSSQNTVINWQSFSIGTNETVNFVQPSSSSVALNRVLGSDPSSILGSLTANGKVFLINPNGILFGAGARVNVGGLVASTRNISDSDFLDGQYIFNGDSSGGIANQGFINAEGGYVALLGANVSNQGVISAKLGNITLAAGNAITLDVAGDGLLNVTVNAGTVAALVQNGGLLQADGGQVLLTAKSASGLLQSAVNNTGVIQAQTIATHNGVIRLLGDMQSGTLNAGGTLDASAATGDGGFVETSAAHVQIAADAIVTTAASQGATGQWLIDPVDFNIAASGGDITGAVLSSNLGSSNIVIQSSSGTSGTSGDVNVNDTVTWSANKLTLNAQNNININTAMNASGTASLALVYGQSAVAAGNTSVINVNAPVNLPAGNNFSTQLGSNGAVINYTVITSLGAAGSTSGTDLQGISGNLAGNYVLGSDINAAATSTWNSGAGFTPIGTDPARFTGIFDGLGHTVSGIYINRTGSNFTGLFGYTGAGSMVRNVGLIGGSVTSDSWSTGSLVGALSGTLFNTYATTNVTGFQTAGGLVGVIDGGLIDSSHASGTVFSSNNGEVGGLVGLSWGPGGGVTRNSYATGNVSSTVGNVGGLMGINWGTIINSYATGTASGTDYIGGLVGNNSNGSIAGSYATGAVTGNNQVGGLAGNNSNSITNSHATGTVNGIDYVGGLTGSNNGTINNNYTINTVAGRDYVGGLIGSSTGTTTNNYATGTVTGRTRVGGLVGYGAGTINTNYATGTVTASGDNVGGLIGYNYGGTITNNYATGAVTGIYSIGGLVGLNTTGMFGSSGAFSGNYASGAVSASSFAGGLIGTNYIAVSNSYATGSVIGGDQIGGLVGGFQSGSISNSYATGNVTATTGAAGGLVGYASATISNSYASGAVSGVNQVGGILGAMNGGSITDSYATGSVTGTGSIGGAVGNSTNGAITRAYSSGAVTGTTNVGGLLGSSSSATVTNSFWDLTTSGQASSAGGTGLTTTQMLTASNFTGFNFTTTPGATGNNWVMVNFDGTLNGSGDISGGTRPMLASEYSTTITNAHQLQLMGMNLSANYTLANNIELAADLANSSSLWHAGSGGFAPIGIYGVYNGTFDGLGHTISGLSINRPADAYVGLFAAVGTTATVRNVGLIGGNVTGDVYVGGLAGRIEGTVTNSFATTNVNGNFSVGGLVGAVFATGALSNSYASGTATSQFAGGLVGLNQGAISNSYATGAAIGDSSGGLVGRNVGGTISDSYAIGTVTGNNSGGFTSVNTGTISNSYASGAVTGTSTGGFAVVNAGTITNSFWNTTTSGQATSAGGTGLTTAQLQAALPSGFSSATWGNSGNQTTPYLLTNAGPVLITTDTSTTYYNIILTLNQLQNVSANLAGNYALGADLNANATSSWNNGSGFMPLGDGTTQFTGSFDGLGHVISNLTINRPTTDYVGLFGYAAAANVNHLGLVNATITGQDAVGAMFGATVVGNAARDYATGQVTGRFSVGGLIGYNNTSIVSSSYATSNVAGVDKVGGLMGETNGGIASMLNYASGNVTASGNYVGGLIGYNGFAFLVNNSYATGNVSGVAAVGGLVGYHLNGDITQSYSTGNVAGSSDVGGLVGYTSTGTVSNSYWNSTTSGQASSAGGAALTSLQMQQQANFAGWDFSSTWLGYDGHTNPLLRTFMTSLTVTANDATKTYNGQAYNGSAGVSYSATPNMSNLLGTLSLTAGINAGTSAITVSGLYSNQQGYAINYANGTLTVDKAVLTATATASNKAYDGSTTASATLTNLSGLVGTETINTSNSATFNSKDVASANLVTVNSITLSDGTNGGLASNYSLASGQTAAANITAKALTTTVTAPDKVYDGNATANATLTALNGLVGSETVSATGTATFNSKNVASANLVTVNSTLLADGANGGLASNYSLASGQTVAANITTKALTATVSTANKVYDGNTTASATLSNLTGFIGTETVTATGAASFNSKDVAVANLVTVNSTTLADGNYGGLASNYSLASGETAAANITAKALTANVAAPNKVYDGNATASATLNSLSGLIGSESVTAGGTATFNSKDVAVANLVTVNSTTLTDGSNGGLASNYSLSTGQTVAASITAKVLTATASAANKIYDGNTTASATLNNLTGFVGTETVTANGTASFNSKDVVAANLVTVNSTTLVDGTNGGLASNYSLANGQTVAANITAKTLAATVAASNKVYDGNTTASATLTSLTGLIGAETVTATGAATFNSKDVAAANVVTINSATLSDGSNGGLANNYTLASGQTVSASISAKALSATVTASNKIYDGNTTANAALTGISGLIGSETVSASGTATFNSKDVASASLVTVNSITLGDGANGGLASNYSLAGGQSVAANITAKVLSATATASNKTYDGTSTAAITLANLTGLVGIETVTATGAATFNSKDVLSANLVTVNSTTLLDGANGGLASNYSLTNGQTATANISAKALMATVHAQSKVYDGNTTANATLNNLSGLIGAETIGASGAATFNSKDVAAANLVTVNSATLTDGANGGLASNYTLASGQTAAATITAKALAATVTVPSKVYDGNTTASATLTGLTGLIGTETVTASGAATFNSKDVAAVNLVTVNSTTLIDGSNGGLASNYSLASGQTAAANITTKALTATATAANKIYDGTTTATAALNSLTGLVGAETVTASGVATFNSKDVTAANLVTVNSTTLIDGVNGGLASNYSLAGGQTAVANITAKALTATVAVANKVYDGNATASATLNNLTGLVGAETISATGTATFNSKDVATANLVTVNSTTLMNGSNGGVASNYSLVSGQTIAANINTKALTATATALSKVYDGSATATAALQLSGLVGSETVMASSTATFNSKDVALANLVTVNGTALADGTNGGLASNYSLASGQTAAATITAKTLTATVVAANKVYDGNNTASTTLNISGLIGTETVNASGTATFNSKDVVSANLVTVNSTTLMNGSNGGLASNYSLAGGQTVAANITPKALTILDQAALDKVYDGTTAATLTGGLLAGVVAGETVALNESGTFTTASVGNGIAVAATNSLGGVAAANYTLTQPAGLAASIVPVVGYQDTIGVVSSTAQIAPAQRSATASVNLPARNSGVSDYLSDALNGLNLTVITQGPVQLPSAQPAETEDTNK